MVFGEDKKKSFPLISAHIIDIKPFRTDPKPNRELLILRIDLCL
jgi:hypothetical protein